MDDAKELSEEIISNTINLLLGLGVVGNALALIAFGLETSHHFILFRAITGVELLFCLLNLGEYLLQRYYMIGIVYKSYEMGVLMTTVRQFINSSISYMVSYWTLMIAVDRCFAVFTPCQYHNTLLARKRRIIFTCIIVVLILSTAVHSWASFARWIIVEIEVSDEFKFIDDNVTTVYYALAPRQLTHDVQRIYDLQTFYNGLFNVTYPILLVTLTILVIVGLIRTRSAHFRLYLHSARRESRTRRDRCLM